MSIDAFNQNLDQITTKLRKNLDVYPRDYKWRIGQLKALRSLLKENDTALCTAMWGDLRKSKFECVATEQGVVLSEIEDALKHLHDWMKPRKVRTPLYNLPGSCQIRHDPLGLALIIGAWNYPINLLLAPLVGAIAGGNAVLLKPSELAVQTAKTLVELIPRYMDTNLIAIIEAGPQETSELLERPFDTIFFTGSGNVGKIVMGKAAQNLTPVTLELGGKSPAMVLEDADIAVTARRLTWGKFMNAGQTCVAPDYILVHPSVKQRLIDEIQKNITRAYGANAKTSPDYCRIINRRNFDRLSSLMQGERILFGGETDPNELYIAPTLVESRLSSPIMQEEIFGPILPIIEMTSLQEMLALINSRPPPLSLYLFSKSKEHEETVLQKTKSGGVCINDVVMHMPVAELPFGGVGASGMGHYHGEFSFRTFTHAKGILRKSTWVDIPVRYAPYLARNLKILRWLF
jgi:acyl-CoA reductase-like NAD-dependent aldehyde dehydrogenase